MLRTLLAISLFWAGAAFAREIKLAKRYVHPWNQAGWNVYAHNGRQGEQLVALNRNTFSIEVLDPKTGETITQDSLDTKARGARLIETLSTRSGDFLIAFAAPNGTVELHRLDGEVAFEIPFSTPPSALNLVERASGEIFLLVTVGKITEVYQMRDDQLERNPFEEFNAAKLMPSSQRVLGMRGGAWKLWPMTAKRGAVLSVINRESEPARIDLPAGDAHWISDVGAFTLHGTKHFFFVKDHSGLVIQSENGGTAVPNKKHERIVSVNLVPSARALAVVLENAGVSRLMMVGFH